MSEGEEKIDELVRELAATRAGLTTLGAEVRRLTDLLEKVITADPPKTKRVPEAPAVDGSLEEVVGRVAIKGFGALFGGKRRKA